MASHLNSIHIDNLSVMPPPPNLPCRHNLNVRVGRMLHDQWITAAGQYPHAIILS